MAEEQEVEVEIKAAPKSSVEELLALDDPALMEALGLTRQLESAKENLQKISKLTGKAREFADSRLEELLTPRIGDNNLRYLVEDAERIAKKGGKEALNDCSPCSVM